MHVRADLPGNSEWAEMNKDFMNVRRRNGRAGICVCRAISRSWRGEARPVETDGERTRERGRAPDSKPGSKWPCWRMGEGGVGCWVEVRRKRRRERVSYL